MCWITAEHSFFNLDIAFNLINDIDIAETEARVERYRKENAPLIELNLRREEQYIQALDRKSVV